MSSCHVSSPHPLPFSHLPLSLSLSLSLPFRHFHSRLQGPHLFLLFSSNPAKCNSGSLSDSRKADSFGRGSPQVMAISLLLPDIAFISPNPSRGHRFNVSRKRCCVSRTYVGGSSRGKVRTRALNEEVLLSGSVNGCGLNGRSNGVATTSRISNGSVGNGGGNGYVVEETVVLEERELGNGSLVRYVNGNGNGVAEVERASTETTVVEGMMEMGELEEKEEGRKRRIEEIGKEEAWFKQSGSDQLEVKAMMSVHSLNSNTLDQT